MLRKKILLTAAIAAITLSAFAASAAVPAAGSVGDVPFPDKQRSYLSKGDFVNIENLRQMKSGLSKDQVRLLLGNPHFKEGIAGAKEWNYIFNFRTGVGEEYITCQYQVRYAKDHGYAVQSMHWDGPACLELLNRPEAPAAAAPVPREKRISLSADALFAFARSGANDILPNGREQLEAIAGQLEAGSQVRVIGHTDRIGSDAANQLLSQRRAESVRGYLIDHGVPASAISAEGRGESEPVKACDDGGDRRELIACLQPNRRVEITTTAGQ